MTTHTTSSKIRIGLVCQPKKRKQFFEPFREHVNSHPIHTHVECFFLSFDEEDNDNNNNNNNHHVDVMFLKVTDDMNIAHLDAQASERLKRLRTFIEQRPHMLVVEDLEAVQRVLDRVVMYSFLHSQLTTKLQSDSVHVPPITILNQDVKTIEQIQEQFNRDRVQFPIVCKTVAACGELKTHNMALVFNEEQLLQVLNSPEQEIPLPIVAQQYINHDALLYKAYVIGDNVYVQERTSLRNMTHNEPQIIRFNSQHHLPQELLPVKSEEEKHAIKHHKPLITDENLLTLFKDITKTLSQALELDLFGFDLIKDVNTGKYYCVDANFLPGYSGVEDVHEKMLGHILTRYDSHKQQKSQ